MILDSSDCGGYGYGCLLYTIRLLWCIPKNAISGKYDR